VALRKELLIAPDHPGVHWSNDASLNRCCLDNSPTKIALDEVVLQAKLQQVRATTPQQPYKRYLMFAPNSELKNGLYEGWESCDKKEARAATGL
jgi:hypothetical protein